MDTITAPAGPFIEARLRDTERAAERRGDLDALAWCETFRSILLDHPTAPDGTCQRCLHRDGARQASPCRTIRALAHRWETHPDHRQEWRP